jgi:two-component system chemotaxis response regulator CheB
VTRAPIEAIAIGGSAGGVQALLQLLPALPGDFALPVMVVLHVPPEHDHTLVALFGARCALPVMEAADKDAIAHGTIYFAPADYHLLVEPDRTFALSAEEPVNHSRPAIDPLLQSAADAYGSGLVGIVLSGANQDGAEGLAAVSRAGGLAIVQDPAKAQVPTMPEAALTACPGAAVLSLDDTIAYLLNVVSHEH